MQKTRAMRAFWLGAFLAMAGCEVERPEIRSMPSEAMLPTLLVGDKVMIDRNVYTAESLPHRGDVLLIEHPARKGYILIKRVVGLPGDKVQMKRGRLELNGTLVERTLVRTIKYVQDRSDYAVVAIEYREQLPGEAAPHLIHEFADDIGLDDTPLFEVPPGRVFLMGDNRDNSEDSRAPLGHRALAAQSPDAWPWVGVNLRAPPEHDAIGFVPAEKLMGRAVSVVRTDYACEETPETKAEGVECFVSEIDRRL